MIGIAVVMVLEGEIIHAVDSLLDSWEYDVIERYCARVFLVLPGVK